jgi:hypothetical protein
MSDDMQQEEFEVTELDDQDLENVDGGLIKDQDNNFNCGCGGGSPPTGSGNTNCGC